MIRIGIECEQLEGKRFGVGHTLAQFLAVLVMIPDIEKQYHFILYFKAEIPKDTFLSHLVFEKKILTGGFIPKSFNIFYHLLIPWQYFKDELDLFFFPSYMLPALFFGKAVVVLVNDIPWEIQYGSLPWRYRLSYRIFCFLAAKRAKKIMTISQVSSHDLQTYYNISKERLVINPWGINKMFSYLERTQDYDVKISDLKKTFGISQDFFLSVGQAFPRRHVKEAMKAFESIAKQYPYMQYLVACADKYKEPILAPLAEKINKNIGRKAIIYTTYLKWEDMVYIMNATKAMVYISDKEALGLPPIEALACYTPAIIADTEITREIFGDKAFFVRNPKNLDNIAGVMIDLLTHQQKVLEMIKIQSSRLAHYDWSTHASKTLAVFDEIAKNNS